jgi:dTDP-glucose 4,6-dehydratase/UDP-glucose 4-epimerase
MMKILLTGSSGYIGSSLRKRLGGRVSFITYDIKENPKDNVLDLSRLKKAARGVDGVLHLAAVSRPKWGYKEPLKCIDTNIMGTANVLEAVRKSNPRAWVIFSSSREVYAGLDKFPVDEKSPRNPLNAYGVSKVCGEDLLKQYAENYGLRCLTLRFCGVYTGARDILDRVVPRFIGLALRGKPITIEGRGVNYGDFVYISDLLDAIERAIEFVNSKPRGFYDDINLVSAKPIALYDLARLIIKMTKSKSRIVYLPPRPYDLKGFWGSRAKAGKLLGWKPKVPLETGLAFAIDELKPIFQKRSYNK